MLAGLIITATLARAQEEPAPDPAPAPADAAQAAPEREVPAQDLVKPPDIPVVPLGPVLKTTPVRRGEAKPNVQLVDTVPLTKDREGIWILEFAFKPVRITTVEIPGKGRRIIHYMYYRVINRTGKPRMFVPQFVLVTDTGKRCEDTVLPNAVSVIQAREGATTPLLGAVDVVGILPNTGDKEGIDDAIYGVAIWDNVDPKANAFKVYVRGLSDGYQVVAPPDASGGGEPQIRYKTLRIDFTRPGDEYHLHESEIHLADPPYEWIYW